MRSVTQAVNTGSLGSRPASPAFVLAQTFAAHGVRVAAYVREAEVSTVPMAVPETVPASWMQK